MMDDRSRTIATTIIETAPLFVERFRIVRPLGEGAASVVYHAVDLKRDGREVALKVLTNRQAFDERTIDRFFEEIKIAQEIRHPNLVEAYDVIEHDSVIAFTMEFVRGKDLSHSLRNGLMPYAEIEKILSQVLSALSELHRRGLCHRDIKLENILLRSDGVVKVSDLGLVKREGSSMTATGVLLGTAQYFPPEYVRRSIYDAQGDVYALGLVLWELLQGERWLPGLNGAEAIQRLLRSRFALPPVTARELTTKYRSILTKALAVEPRKRFASADEMRAAVEGVGLPNAAAAPRSFLQAWSSAVRRSEKGVAVQDYAGDRARYESRMRLLALTLVAFILAVMAFSRV